MWRKPTPTTTHRHGRLEMPNEGSIEPGTWPCDPFHPWPERNLTTIRLVPTCVARTRTWRWRCPRSTTATRSTSACQRPVLDQLVGREAVSVGSCHRAETKCTVGGEQLLPPSAASAGRCGAAHFDRRARRKRHMPPNQHHSAIVQHQRLLCHHAVFRLHADFVIINAISPRLRADLFARRQAERGHGGS